MARNRSCTYSLFFFFNDTATTEIYTLSLHDALPISPGAQCQRVVVSWPVLQDRSLASDRKSTRLNSSHGYILYAVFCMKKKEIIGPLKDSKNSEVKWPVPPLIFLPYPQGTSNTTLTL